MATDEVVEEVIIIIIIITTTQRFTITFNYKKTPVREKGDCRGSNIY